MIDGRRCITFIIAGLVCAAAVHADMVPVSSPDAGRPRQVYMCSRTDIPCPNLSSPLNSLSVAHLDIMSVRFLPPVDVDIAQVSQTQHALDLANQPGSLSLCLYALLGLGLCNSAHWVRKISLGCIPEWYHSGGPFQIGHSLAISPESLRPAPACCFIQPVWTAERLIPQYRLRTVVSCWRKSQFTPDVIASRGPPLS